MPQKFRLLPGVDVNLHSIAMYENGGDREVDGKAFNAEYIITQ